LAGVSRGRASGYVLLRRLLLNGGQAASFACVLSTHSLRGNGVWHLLLLLLLLLMMPLMLLMLAAQHLPV